MAEPLERLTAALADRYRIERELGAGGMATVYLARDLKHEREVAIKVLREDLSASLGAGRFLREIKIAAQLQHPNILPLLDSGEADGFLYFVMPYIKGQSLRERLAREGELPVEEAVRLTMEVVDALGHAHENSVVHRDIKPDNVMLSGRHALVADFGVAKAISEATDRQSVTTLGVAVGTPAYMSPEQAAADPHVDHRSDIYSVGVMAYELLTGRPPFTASTPQQILAAQVTESPDPVSKRRPSIPPALEQIVMRCLAKRPADRFQSASELHAALEPLATTSPGITPTQTRPVAAIATPRHRVLLIGAAVVLVAIGAYAATRLSPEKAVVSIRTQLTYSGRASDVTLSPDGAYISYTEKGECAGASNCPATLIIQEVAVHGVRRAIAIDSTGSGRIVGWSPDARRFLLSTMVSNRNRLSLETVLGGEIIHELSGNAAWSASPDSLFIWDWQASTDSTIWIRTADANTAVSVDSFRFGPAAWVDGVIESPDRRWLLIEYHRSFTAPTSTLVVVSRQGRVVDTIPSLDGALNWGARSDRIYLRRFLGGNQTEVVRQSITRSGRRIGIPAVATRLSAADISLSGEVLAYAERGLPESELWALEWSNGPKHQPTSHVVHRTTAAGTGQISRDGTHMMLYELKGSGDSSAAEFSTIPFGKGERTPFGGLRLGRAMSFGLSGDESRAVISERRDGRSILTILSDPRSGAGRELATNFPDSGWVTLLANDHVLWQPRSGHDFVILNAKDTLQRRLPWPDSLGLRMPYPWPVSPDGMSVAVLAVRAQGDSVQTVLYRFSLPDGRATRMGGSFALALGEGRLDWAGWWPSDGWFPLQRSDGVGRKRLIRVDLTSGKVVDDGPLPVTGDVVQFWYAENRRRASAWVTRYRSDVVLLRHFDPGGN